MRSLRPAAAGMKSPARNAVARGSGHELGHMELRKKEGSHGTKVFQVVRSLVLLWATLNRYSRPRIRNWPQANSKVIHCCLKQIS